jgi:ABC-type polysaccharide/polyol phosphate transport system ATPase subunit
VLKILSRVTRATSGSVRVDGRVGALIEVGAGFHPDLTGLENIYLSGAILGLTRREIDAKLDSIIDFAGLAPFMDTPVKRYSSGMYVRLGFSVAVHIEPEILLIDEVLSVGDYAFREKCIQKINEFHEDGRTMVVVSHDPSMLQKFCSRAILLCPGRAIMDGEVRAVLDEYHTGAYLAAQHGLPVGEDVSAGAGDATRPVEILSVQVTDRSSTPRQRFLTGEPLKIVVDFVCHQDVQAPIFYCDIHHGLTWVTGTNNGRTGASASFKAGQHGRIEMIVESLNVLTGQYHLDVGAVSDYFAWRPYHVVYHAAEFEVTAGLEHGAGLVYLPHSWQFEQSEMPPEGSAERPRPARV